MTSLTYEEVFEAAAKIILTEEYSITITLNEKTVSIRFPTTRRLAEYLQIPHYYILPYFAMMEQNGIITRVERVGISTTKKGTKKLFELMATKFLKESKTVLGAALFEELQRRIRTDR